jgi:hypothetical protein
MKTSENVLTRDLVTSMLRRPRESVTDRFLEAFQAAASDDEKWLRARGDPRRFLATQGFDVPDDLEVIFDEQLLTLEPKYNVRSTLWRCFWHCDRDEETGKIDYTTCERYCIYFYEFEEVAPGPREMPRLGISVAIPMTLDGD